MTKKKITTYKQKKFTEKSSSTPKEGESKSDATETSVKNPGQAQTTVEPEPIPESVQQKPKIKPIVKKAEPELEDGEYDSEDLELCQEGVNIEDFEDPVDYITDEDEEDEYDEYDDEGETEEFEKSMGAVYGLLGEFLEYDNQNIVEVLCQIRDSVDANSKCMLRIAHEIRNLQNAYLHFQSTTEEADAESKIAKAIKSDK